MQALERRWEDLSRVWPGVQVSPGRLAERVRSILGDDGVLDDRLHLSDLLLAVACADGDDAAIKAFDAAYIVPTRASLSSLHTDAAFVDEAQQRLRTRLLVAEPARRPRIADYQGRGPLAAWVGVAAIRVGLVLLRERTRADKFSDDRWAAAIALPNIDDPELAQLKTNHRDRLRDALVLACGKLRPRDRAVLRMYFGGGLNIEKIGAVYGVHRSTVARWIVRARQEIATSVLEYLSEAGSLPEEISSLNRLVTSQLDISLTGLLGPSAH